MCAFPKFVKNLFNNKESNEQFFARRIIFSGRGRSSWHYECKTLVQRYNSSFLINCFSSCFFLNRSKLEHHTGSQFYLVNLCSRRVDVQCDYQFKNTEVQINPIKQISNIVQLGYIIILVEGTRIRYTS